MLRLFLLLLTLLKVAQAGKQITATLPEDRMSLNKTLIRVELTTQNKPDAASRYSLAKLDIVFVTQGSGGQKMQCSTNILSNVHDYENFGPGKTDVYEEGFGFCEGINFAGMEFEKFGITLESQIDWGAEKFELFFSDGTKSGCRVRAWVHDGETFWCDKHDTYRYINKGRKRFLKRIEVRTMNLPNATMSRGRIKIVIDHDNAVLCKTDYLDNGDHNYRQGETKVFLPHQGFGGCQGTNFAGIELNSFGIKHQGQQAWGADRFTLYFSDNHTEVCIINKFMQHSSQLWCDKSVFKALSKIEILTMFEDDAGTKQSIRIEIDRDKKKLCKTDSLKNEFGELLAGRRNDFYRQHGFGECEYIDFTDKEINRYGIIHSGQGKVGLQGFNLHFSDGSNITCKLNSYLLNDEVAWCDKGVYLKKIEIVTTRNCQGAMAEGGNVRIELEQDDKRICRTNNLNDKDFNNFESGCTDVFSPENGFGDCINKDFTSINITRMRIIHSGDDLWGFESFTLFFNGLPPITCWGNRFMNFDDQFSCEAGKPKVIQLEFKVNERPGSGMYEGKLLVAISNSADPLQTCRTYFLRQNMQVDQIWRENTTYTFSELNALPVPNQQDHPVFGNCGNIGFEKINEIGIRHVGGDDIVLDYIRVYLDDATYISCPVGTTQGVKKHNFRCALDNFEFGSVSRLLSRFDGNRRLVNIYEYRCGVNPDKC